MSDEGLGLSSSEDEAPPSRAERSGLGLDSDDEENASQAIAPGPSKPLKQSDGLGLSDSEDEEEIKIAPALPPAARVPTLPSNGLDSDQSDDENGNVSSGAGARAEPSSESSTVRETLKAPTRESKLHTFSIPKLQRPRPNVSSHVVKLPPQLGVDPEQFAFAPGQTLASMEENVKKLEGEGGLDEDIDRAVADLEAARRFVDRESAFQSSILWRSKDTNGTTQDKPAKRESNTNLVKWSDGSMQLHVGTDVYEVNTLRTDQGFIYVKQADISGARNQTVLECHGPVDSRFGLRVAGINSNALKKMKSKSSAQNPKASRIQVFAVTEDHSQTQSERNKKAKARVNRSRDGSSGLARPLRPRPRMGGDFLEYDEENVSSLKAQYHGNDSGGDDDSDSGLGRRLALRRPRSSDGSNTDEASEDGSDEEEEDENVIRGKKKRRATTLDDDDDDGSA